MYIPCSPPNEFVFPVKRRFIRKIYVNANEITIGVPEEIPISTSKIYLPMQLKAVAEMGKCFIEYNGKREERRVLISKKTPYVTIRKNVRRIILEPRKWVNVLINALPEWWETLDIFKKHRVVSAPSYTQMAFKKLERMGLPKILLPRLTNMFLGTSFRHTAGKYRDVSAELNWVAGIFVLGRIPTFKHIGTKQYGIVDPKLPIKIRSPDMAELLGIWSGDGSLYDVYDSKYGRTIITFAIISTNKDLLDRVHRLIENIFGQTTPAIYMVTSNKLQYRYRNVIIIESLLRAGARIGRKPDIFTEYEIPDWIKTSKENIIRWFRGYLDCDAYLKAIPKKHDYSVTYSRNITAKISKECIKTIQQYGFFNPHTLQYEVNISLVKDFLTRDNVRIPNILRDEKLMLLKLVPTANITIRPEAIFYSTKTKKTTIKWVLTIYGRETIKKLLNIIRPPRLITKLHTLE